MAKIKRNLKEAYESFIFECPLWDWLSVPYHRIRGSFHKHCFDLQGRCQRFRRGYARSDVWNLDHWFIATLKPMLDDLLEHHHGYPSEITDQEWEAILREMIHCLTLMDEDAAQAYLGITDEGWSPEKHLCISAAMEENKHRFFELFEKWFYALWD